MTTDKIGVGIIGAGGWARYGHIPALRTLDVAAHHVEAEDTFDELVAALGVPTG
jgi:predicted dehydrogenase